MMTFVYAQDRDGGIGYLNDLPWHLPNDLKFFKETTMGHTIVMGRKTFEAMNRRLLPGRTSVVVTSQKNYGSDIEGLFVVHDLEEIKEMAKDEHLMIIGGAKIFLELLPYAEQVIRTVINESFLADVYMPAINEAEWTLVKVREGVVDEKNKYTHQYQWWQRNGETS